MNADTEVGINITDADTGNDKDSIDSITADVTNATYTIPIDVLDAETEYVVELASVFTGSLVRTELVRFTTLPATPASTTPNFKDMKKSQLVDYINTNDLNINTSQSRDDLINELSK